MSELQGVIAELVASKKEGEYWDFKLKHHDDPADLVKDIICLANTVRHTGERYLIMGVDPQTYQVTGINHTQKRPTQADIINTLRDANFAIGRFPDIILESIQLDGRDVDVIIVSDMPHKPYYIEEDRDKNNKTIVRAGVVYARTQDTNTPSNKIASAIDIERMWRERFGLTQTPLERVLKYLENPEDWVQMENVTHHKFFPEFTIVEGNQDNCLAYQQEWTRGEIGAAYSSGNVASYFDILYHATRLAWVHIVIFDGGKKSVVAPDYQPFSGGRFYCYMRNSLPYAFQRYWVEIHGGKDYSKNLHQVGTGKLFSIPVFEDKQDLEKFLCLYRPRQADLSPLKDQSEQNTLFYAALQDYETYRKDNPRETH